MAEISASKNMSPTNNRAIACEIAKTSHGATRSTAGPCCILMILLLFFPLSLEIREGLHGGSTRIRQPCKKGRFARVIRVVSQGRMWKAKGVLQFLFILPVGALDGV